MLMFPPVPFNPMTMTMVPPPTVMMPQETAVKVNARHSPSGSDGSHHLTHLRGRERGTRARGSVFAGKRSSLDDRDDDAAASRAAVVAKNARLEALQVPDRTQDAGYSIAIFRGERVAGMMANGSDKENERSLGQPSRVAVNEVNIWVPLSVKCPKKRRTTKNSRARSNLKTFDALPRRRQTWRRARCEIDGVEQTQDAPPLEPARGQGFGSRGHALRSRTVGRYQGSASRTARRMI